MKILSSFIVIVISIFLFSCSGREYEKITPGTKQLYKFQYTNLEGKRQNSKFILSVPLNYDPQKKFPMLVALHGYGSNPEAFNELWKPETDSLGVILLTPEGDDTTEEGIGFKWSEGADLMLLTCMDAAVNIANIDQAKIYVAGFSMGGTLAYKMIFNYPRIFSGVAALSAELPEYYKTESLEFLKGKKFYVTAGELEEERKEDANKTFELLIKNEILVQHTIYFDVGHGLPQDSHSEIKKIIKYLFVDEEKQK